MIGIDPVARRQRYLDICLARVADPERALTLAVAMDAFVSGAMPGLPALPPPAVIDAEPELREFSPRTRVAEPPLHPKAQAIWSALAGLLKHGPSPSIRQIAETAQVGISIIRHHLGTLERRGLIRHEGHRYAPKYAVVVQPPVITDSPPPPAADAHRPVDVHRNAYRKPQRRFTQHRELDPGSVRPLAEDHAAVVEGRTLFPTTVVDPADADRVLVSGVNNRKIGDRISKGPWAGMPIFMLGLEERATCPVSCHHWRSCYGNGMPRARRHRHGPELMAALAEELAELQRRYPRGFVVRLHSLGDFYSVDYVKAWGRWIVEFPALRVMGFTAWQPDTPIGEAVTKLRDVCRNRFAIRTSTREPRETGAVTIWRKPESARVPEGIVCPAQTGATECCGSCGLCWHPAAKDRTIVFVAHGARHGRPPGKPGANGLARRPWPAELRAIEEASKDTATHLDTAVRRRCAVCEGIFRTRRVSEVVCPSCASRKMGARLEARV